MSMIIPTVTEFSESAYLIYKNFITSKKIGGSLLVDCAITEEEAEQKCKMYMRESVKFYKDFPNLLDGECSHVYIKNKAYWWQR